MDEQSKRTVKKLGILKRIIRDRINTARLNSVTEDDYKKYNTIRQELELVMELYNTEIVNG